VIDGAEERQPSSSRHFLAWLRFLWSRVLFLGQTGEDRSLKLASLFLLLIIPSALLYPKLSFHLFEPDEGRYAEIPREMLLENDWIVPYLQGEPYLDKPPLLYWLVGISYRIFGAHDWSARLIPALAVHGCVLLTYLLGRKSLGERAALYGALMLSLAPGFITVGRLLILDGLLAFFVTLSLYAGFEAVRQERLAPGWWLVAAVSCGLGVLTKGPVALVLLVPPLWFYRCLAGRACRISAPALAGFAAVTLLIALPWYVAICLRLPRFAYYFLWQHNIVRFFAPFDHLRPVWFYGPVLLFGLLPATLLVPSVARFLLSIDPLLSAKRCPELGFSFIAGGWCVLFFSLSGSKLPTYILPAFPPLALALGYCLANGSNKTERLSMAVATTAFVLLFIGHNVLLPWYAGYRGAADHLFDVKGYFEDSRTPIVCYPRNCDSVAFYVGRNDLRTYRSKETHLLAQFLLQQRRTVLLLTHRHSLEALRHALPSELDIVETRHLGLGDLPGLSPGMMQKLAWLMGETSLGLSDVAVVTSKVAESQLSNPGQASGGARISSGKN
jgi:hypothetical protein